jgi:hypothetical protein
MGKRFWRGFLAGCLLTLVWGAVPVEAAKGKGPVGTDAAVSSIEFRSTMKRLWLEHQGYTRHLVISVLAELPDLEKVKTRLAKNVEDISEEFKTYYGEERSGKLTELLKNQVAVTEEVIRILAKGTDEQFVEVKAKWEAAAEELAAFLNGCNPKWSKQDLTNLLFKQSNALVGQVNARVKKDWDSDFAYYDKSLTGILTFADTLAEGIIGQFPKRFKK